MSSPLARAALLAVALGAPAAARAHGVELDVERSGAEIAVRARYHGAQPLAGATYEVRSPAAPERAHDAGRTDRHGWLVFVPDAPGRWTVRIVDASGHGKVEEIEVPAESLTPPSAVPARAADAAPVASAAAAPAEPAPRPGPPPLRTGEARERADSIYRVVGGFAVIGLVFFVVFAAVLRRRGARR